MELGVIETLADCHGGASQHVFFGKRTEFVAWDLPK